MGLMSCPECGFELSDQARQCPKCAFPFHEQPTQLQRVKRAGGPWEAWGTVLCLAGMIIGMAVNGGLGGALFAVGLIVFIIGRFN